MVLETGNNVLKARRPVVDGVLKEQINSDTFYLPTVETLGNLDNGIYEGYKFLYKSTLPITGKDGDVDNEMLIYQGMALDGCFLAYNTDSEKVSLCTANEKILNSVSSSTSFDLSKCYTNNVEGAVHAMRLDVNYGGFDPDNFTIKAVRLAGKSRLNVENHIFIPFYVITRIFQMFKTMSKAGRVLKVVHEKDTGGKERVVTTNPTVLREFNDDEGFVKSLRALDFRYKSTLYMPVVGSPSTTSGITRINIPKLDEVRVLRKNEVDVEKADNSPLKMVEREILTIFVKQVFNAEESFKKMLFKYLKKYGEAVPYDADMYDYIRAVRDLSDESTEKLWTHIPPAMRTYADKIGSILNQHEMVEPPKDVPELMSLMKGAVYRIVAMRSNGSFYTVYATNNDEILRIVYGKNYVSRYEDYRVRLRSFLYDAERGKSVWGHDRGGSGGRNFGPEDIREERVDSIDPSGIREKLGVYGIDAQNVPGNDQEVLNYYLDQASEAKESHRKGTDDNKGLVRALFTAVTLGETFYRNVIPSRIYSMARVSNYF